MIRGLSTFLIATAAMVGVSAAASPMERREELLKVQEMINDPDPLMRIANFEDIVRSKDAFKVETAIKLAMTSQDKSLRSLATRAYFAAFRVVALEPVLPPDLARKWENAAGDSEARQRLARSNTTINAAFLLSFVEGGKIRFLFSDVDPSLNQGTVAFTVDGVKPSRREVTYRVLGERIVFNTSIKFAGYTPDCDVELRGTKDLEIVGKVVCQHLEVGPLDVTATMF